MHSDPELLALELGPPREVELDVGHVAEGGGHRGVLRPEPGTLDPQCLRVKRACLVEHGEVPQRDPQRVHGGGRLRVLGAEPAHPPGEGSAVEVDGLVVLAELEVHVADHLQEPGLDQRLRGQLLDSQQAPGEEVVRGDLVEAGRRRVADGEQAHEERRHLLRLLKRLLGPLPLEARGPGLHTLAPVEARETTPRPTPPLANATCSSGAMADGRLFLRAVDGIVCFDLRSP